METPDAQLYFTQMLERIASEKRKREEDDEDVAMAEAHEMAAEEDDNGGDGGESFISEGTEFSFEFTNGVSLDLPTGEQMLSAEELFVDGKLKPLAKDGDDVMQIEATDLASDYARSDASLVSAWSSFNDNFTMARRSSDQTQKQNHLRISTIPGFRFDQNAGVVGTSLDDSLALASKHLKSFHESPRCVSMTVEGSRGHNRRSCVSLNSSRCSSPSRTFASSPSRTFAQPQTTPTSPKASVAASSSSSSHVKHSAFSSSKFLEFFKIKKHHSHNPHPNPNSRSFWPFSRSNSAGESKSLPVVLPPPRRSNSAGEGKTSSSSLLPAYKHGIGKHPMAIYSTQHQQIPQQHHLLNKKGSASFPNKNVSGPLDYCTYEQFPSQQAAPSSSLTKLVSMPSSSQQLRHQPASHRLASAISKSQPLQTAISKSQPPQTPHRHASVGSIPASSSLNSHKLGAVPKTHVKNTAAGSRDFAEDQQSYPEYCPPSQSNRSVGSPRRQFRRPAAAPNGTVNNFNRGSPGQQAAWNGPSRGNNLPRGTMRNVDRSSNKGLVRPKDMLNRDTTSIRITPVLNVPACITPSSKSKLFNLGNIFSKKEKAVRGYTMLAPSDSQSGG